MSKLRTNLNEIKIPSFRITNILVIILIFFITLQSFYYEKIGLSIFPIVGTLGLFILAISAYLSRVDKKILSKFVIFFFFVIFLKVNLALIDFFFESYHKTIFSTVINLVAMFSVFLIFHRDKDKLHKVLGSVVALHLFFFYLQVAVWFATDYFIDYVNLLSDDKSVYLSKKGIVLFDQRVPRFTGLFNEPSSYGTWFFSVFSLYYLIERRINWFFILAVLSMLISMSLFSGIFAISIVLIAIFKEFKKPRFSTYGLVLIFFFIIEANYSRFYSNYLGLDIRLEKIENILKPSVLLFGKISGHSCSSVSFITNLICGTGIFYGLLFLAVLFFSYSFSSFASFAFVSMMLVSKIKFNYPIFWIYITIIFILSNFASRRVNKDLLRGYSKTSD